MVQLTKHFSLQEMIFSDTAARHGIDNTPNAEELANLTMTANMMEKVRDCIAAPIIVTSAYRNWRVNEIIGGSTNSSHCLGLAVDFKVSGIENWIICEAIQKSSIKFDQLILEYGWCHIGFGPQMRRECLTKKSSASAYEKGLLHA